MTPVEYRAKAEELLAQAALAEPQSARSLQNGSLAWREKASAIQNACGKQP